METNVYIEYIDSILKVGSITNKDFLKNLIIEKQPIIQKWLNYQKLCKILEDKGFDEDDKEWPEWPFVVGEVDLFSEDDCWGDANSWYIIPLRGDMYYTTPAEFTKDGITIPIEFKLGKFCSDSSG